MVDKIYARISSLVEQDFSEEKKKAVMNKMKVFFGPSRQFTSVFKAAVMFSVEQKQQLHHDEQKKEKYFTL